MRSCDKCKAKKQVEYTVEGFDFCYTCWKKASAMREGAAKKILKDWISKPKRKWFKNE